MEFGQFWTCCGCSSFSLTVGVFEVNIDLAVSYRIDVKVLYFAQDLIKILKFT